MARILLVDDEPSILSMLTALLNTAGHTDTISALGGKAALDLLKKHEFDIMITDVRMSPIDGMELLKAALEKCPSMAVVMLTAYGQVDTAIQALQLGAFDYIRKPFKSQDLLTTVERALASRNSAQQPPGA